MSYYIVLIGIAVLACLYLFVCCIDHVLPNIPDENYTSEDRVSHNYDGSPEYRSQFDCPRYSSVCDDSFKVVQV